MAIKRIRIGDLDERVIILALTQSQSASGASVEAYGAFLTVWGKVEYLTGREYWEAAQEASDTVAMITIRWRSDVSTLNRLQVGDRVFDIESAQQVGRRVFLALTARARTEATATTPA